MSSPARLPTVPGGAAGVASRRILGADSFLLPLQFGQTLPRGGLALRQLGVNLAQAHTLSRLCADVPHLLRITSTKRAPWELQNTPFVRFRFLGILGVVIATARVGSMEAGRRNVYLQYECDMPGTAEDVSFGHIQVLKDLLIPRTHRRQNCRFPGLGSR